MSIDSLNRGIPTSTPLGGTDVASTNNTPLGGDKGLAKLLNPEDLLKSAKLLGDTGTARTGGLPPPPEGTESADSAAKALAGLANLSDTQVNADIYAFMALFQKLAQQMRDTARTQRTTDMQAQVTALQSAAEKIKDAAAERFNAAIVQGVTQIVSGAIQMGVSSASISSTVKGAKLQSGVDRLDPKAALDGGQIKATQLTARGQALMNTSQAAGGIAGGIGGIAGASFTHKADMHDAEKASLETQAKVAETGVQHANDMMQQMMDVIRDVREKLSSIQQASIETNRGIARNI